MLYQNFALLAVAFASVSALPTEIGKRDDFVNDAKGNIRITFSDQTIKLGTISIDAIVGELYDVCSTQGQCDTSPFDLKGQFIAPGLGGSVKSATLTVNPSGSYPTWIHNGLLDAIGAAVKAVAKCEKITRTSTCPNPMAYCPSRTTTHTQCVVPQYWGINYQAPDLGNAAPPFIGADMSIESDSDGFCSTFTTVGSAVAGAVSGVAGGIFSLASLACETTD